MNRPDESGPAGASHQHAEPTHARPGDDAGCCGGRGHAAPARSGGCCGGSGSAGGGCCGGSAHSAEDGVYVFSRRQIRELDRLAAAEFGMPSLLLMENAARGVSGVILEGLQGFASPSALIVCGPGNNGGDGLAVARHLSNRDVGVAVVLAAPEARLTPDALTNLRIVRAMGIPVFDAAADPAALEAALEVTGAPDVVVDALLGTGVERAATGVPAALIGRINDLKRGGSSVVAVDVPSGLDCDTGDPALDESGAPGAAVAADLTLALAGVKAGFLAMNAQAYVGDLIVIDIGAPAELLRRLGHPLTAAHRD